MQEPFSAHAETTLNQPIHSPYQATASAGPEYDLQTGAAPLDDPFLSFDEFTQNVLANSDYFSYEPTSAAQEQQSLFGGPSSLTVGTPLDNGAHETPHTALTTTIALPDSSIRFEVTPVVERSVERSVELVFEHLYPTYPILPKATVQDWLQNPLQLAKSEQSLVWSICASALVIVDNWPNLGSEQRSISARRFIRRCSQLRLDWDYREEANLYDVLTSLFIAIAYFDLKCRRASWTFAREAITLASVAGLHDDAGYRSLSEEDQVRRRRAYAILYFTERGAGIFDGFPVSILNQPQLPGQILSDENPTIIGGLTALHALFSLLDYKFVQIWNDPMHPVFGSSIYSDLSWLQTRLRELQIESRQLSDIQRADVLITQQWLRLVFWQAALRLGFISTGSEDPAFTYAYPINIAMAMCEVVKSLPPVAIQVHGLVSHTDEQSLP